MPLPKARNEVKCAGCGRFIHPLLFRYLYLSTGWRGRATPHPHTSILVTLCGPCADQVLQVLGPLVPDLRGLPTGCRE